MKTIYTLIVALSASLFANTYHYECQDGYDFTARLDGKEMTLFLPRKTVLLKPVVSASGAKYSNGEITLFTKGDKALLELDALGALTCKNHSLKAMKERAKHDGFDFRAQGNEPGWTLFLAHKSQFVYDYGKERMEFTLPKARQSGDSTLYHYRDKKTTMMIELHHRTCHDTMSDEVFDVIVSIKKNGRLFTGCGNVMKMRSLSR